MVKKPSLLVILGIFVFLASGCVTICAEKVYVDDNSVKTIKKATKTEVAKGPNIVEKADNWVKENLW